MLTVLQWWLFPFLLDGSICNEAIFFVSKEYGSSIFRAEIWLFPFLLDGSICNKAIFFMFRRNIVLPSSGRKYDCSRFCLMVPYVTRLYFLFRRNIVLPSSGRKYDGSRFCLIVPYVKRLYFCFEGILFFHLQGGNMIVPV